MSGMIAVFRFICVSYKTSPEYKGLKLLHFAAATALVVSYKAVARVHNKNTTPWFRTREEYRMRISLADKHSGIRDDK